MDRRVPLVDRDRVVGIPVEGDSVDTHCRTGISEVPAVAFGGEQRDGCGGLEDVSDALGRMVRVDRDIGAAGLEHRVHPDHQIGRTPNRQCHRCLGADAGRNQVAGQLVGSAVQFAIGHGGPVGREDHGDIVRCRGGLLLEFVEQHFRDESGVRGVVPRGHHSFQLIGLE